MNVVRKCWIFLHRHVGELAIPIFVLIPIISEGFVASSDAASSWFSPFYNLQQLLYVWSTYTIPGNAAPNNFPSFFLRLFYSGIASINSNPEFIQKAAWFVFFSFFGILLYRIIKRDYLHNSVLACSAILFLFYNPIAQYFLWGKQHWAYYLIVPYFLSIHWYLKYVRTRTFNILIYISLLWVLFGFAFNQPAYFAPYAIIQLLLAAFYIVKNHRDIRFIFQHVAWGIVFLLLNFVYLLPFIFGGSSYIASVQSTYAGGTQLPILHDLQSVNFLYSFLDTTKGYGDFYLHNIPAFLIVWCSFLLVLFYIQFFKQSLLKKYGMKEQYALFIVLLLIFIFLNKGISEPLSELSVKFYSIKYMYIFRDFKDKFAIALSTILSFLYIFLLRLRGKYRTPYLLGIVVISYVIFCMGWWLPDDFQYSSSLEYLSAIHIPDANTARVLNLPLVDYSFFWNSDPFYSGDNPLKNILHTDVFYTTNQENQDALTLRQELTSGTTTSKELQNFLNTYGIEYILNNKHSYEGDEPTAITYDYTRLDSIPGLTKVADTSEYQLYKYTNFVPRINAPHATVWKVDPVHYDVYLSDVSTTTSLTYLETFDPHWELFIEPYSAPYPCVSPQVFLEEETTECENSYGNYFTRDGQFLFEKPIFQDTHTIQKGYANGWKLNSAYITRTYPASYYKLNTDGSINIRVAIYDTQQSYFLIGMCISIMSLIASALFLCVAFFRKRL